MNPYAMEPNSAETINVALRDHQAGVKDWRFCNLAADLHVWAERMVLEFKLETGTPALMIEQLRPGRLGHYRHGRNAFGLRDEVAIDQDCCQANPFWQVLGVLLHELLHAWQEHNGKPPSPKSRNYHNNEFREKAATLGLLVDRRGYTQYAPGDTPFITLLKKYGLEVPEIPEPDATPIRPGQSKLALYECLCGVKVRVGRSRFNAMCLDCGSVFTKRT
jgi:hypothetical protein